MKRSTLVSWLQLLLVLFVFVIWPNIQVLDICDAGVRKAQANPPSKQLADPPSTKKEKNWLQDDSWVPKKPKGKNWLQDDSWVPKKPALEWEVVIIICNCQRCHQTKLDPNFYIPHVKPPKLTKPLRIPKLKFFRDSDI